MIINEYHHKKLLILPLSLKLYILTFLFVCVILFSLKTYNISGEIRLVDDNMQEAVITLPFSVLQNFPTASVSETNQSTFLKDITIDLDNSESEGMITMSTYNMNTLR